MTPFSRENLYNPATTRKAIICQFSKNVRSISSVFSVTYKKAKIGQRIQCPIPKNGKSCNDKNLQRTQKGAYKPAYKKTPETAECQPLNLPPDLNEIVAVWLELPEHIKAAIKALVQTCIQGD